MEKYKPTAKTIVTEIRHFIVDSVRRTSAGRQAVATEILDATLNQLDVVVTKDNPYTLKDVRHTISISSPSPVILKLVAFGEIPETEARAEKTFHTASVEVGPITAGSFISVTVEDPDVFGPLVNVEAYNVRTGETEFIELKGIKTRAGLYRGFIQSLNTFDAGINFDGTMHCAHGDTIRFTYTDTCNREGYSENISVEVPVVSNIKETEILYNSAITPGRELKIAIYNPGISFIDYASVLNINTGSSRDVGLTQNGNVLVGSLPIEYEDSSLELGASIGDSLQITYTGAVDSTGLHKTIDNIVSVSDPEDVLSKFIVPSGIKLHSVLDIQINDFDLVSPEVTIFINNNRKNLSVPLQLNEVWPSMGIYRGSLLVGPEIALPGDSLNLSYSDYIDNTRIVSASVNVLSQYENVEPEEETEMDTSISKPVELVVNGLFVLNGSFAGTLEISAFDDNEVRCTIIKA